MRLRLLALNTIDFQAESDREVLHLKQKLQQGKKILAHSEEQKRELGQKLQQGRKILAHYEQLNKELRSKQEERRAELVSI